ncbi:MAG: hypothetical protein IJ972_05280 [Campylobacter sp.]|nr:hypothetical protein [Campylobacter sp.]
MNDFAQGGKTPYNSNEKKDRFFEICQNYDRYVATKNFHDAYMLVLKSLKTEKKHTAKLKTMAFNLINADVEKIWAYSMLKYHHLRIDLAIKIDENWLLDRAIEAGYDSIKKMWIGTGVVIGPYPSYRFHSYELKRDGYCYICNNRGPLVYIHKSYIPMLKAITTQLVEEYANQS